MKVAKFVDDIADKPSKGIVWAILIALAVIAVYFGWKKIGEIVKSIGTGISNIADNPVESGNLSHALSWYKNAADTMFNALNKVNTDEDAIYSICSQVRNQDDWNKLVREYGTRTLSRIFSSDLTGTLQVHLRDELWENELAKVKSLMPNVDTGL